MPNFKKEDLIAMDNAYENLMTEETAITDNKQVLDALAEEEQIHLASQIALQCPSSELELLQKKFPLPEETQTFAEQLGQALQARNQLDQLMINPRPDIFLESEAFSSDLCNKFSLLSELLIAKNKEEFILSLVTKTPTEKLSNLTKHLHHCFLQPILTSDTPSFNADIQRAVLLKKQLVTLCNTPQELLTAEEFSIDLFNRFPGLVTAELVNQERKIAIKLALGADPNTHSRIHTVLNLLSTVPENKALFEKIKTKFTKYKTDPSFFAQKLRDRDQESLLTPQPDAVLS